MIRRANYKDIKSIKELLLQVDNVHAKARPDIFIPNRMKYNDLELMRLLDDNTRPVFVYENDEGIVIGHIFCIINDIKNDNNLIDNKELYIDDLCVLEDFRNKGIGRLLYNYVLEFAKENDFDYITLNVWHGNDSAMKFYTDLGLKPRKIYMEKKLKD